MQFNEHINEYISARSRRRLLLNYILTIQGNTWQYLDYSAAAVAVGVSRTTISRYLGELIKSNVVYVDTKNHTIKLNEKYLTTH
jgi:Fic family protein